MSIAKGTPASSQIVWLETRVSEQDAELTALRARLAEVEGARDRTRESGTVLPDGAAFFTASFPLPKDHWIYSATEDGFTAPPPMPFRIGTSDPRRDNIAEMVRAAGRYAVQASTIRGQETDFDPDAMLQNFVVGMLGYWTANGLGADAWQNPSPAPDGIDAALASAGEVPELATPTSTGEAQDDE